MGRGSRGVALVLGALLLAAPAGAFTITNGEASALLRSLGVDGYPGVWFGDPIMVHRGPSSYQPRQVVTYDRRAAGAPRFGRRDSIWHPSPVRNRYVDRSPGTLGGTLGGPTFYHPIVQLPGCRDIDVYADRRPGEAPSCSILLRQRPADLSWGTLGGLAGPQFPYAHEPGSSLRDRWGSTISIVPDLFDPVLDFVDTYGVTFTIDPEPDVVLRRVGDGAETVVAAPIPEPATGALLLAGLCALSAGRRLR